MEEFDKGEKFGEDVVRAEVAAVLMNAAGEEAKKEMLIEIAGRWYT